MQRKRTAKGAMSCYTRRIEEMKQESCHYRLPFHSCTIQCMKQGRRAAATMAAPCFGKCTSASNLFPHTSVLRMSNKATRKNKLFDGSARTDFSSFIDFILFFYFLCRLPKLVEETPFSHSSRGVITHTAVSLFTMHCQYFQESLRTE